MSCPVVKVIVRVPVTPVHHVKTTVPAKPVAKVVVTPGAGGGQPLQFTAVAAAVLSSNCLVHIAEDGGVIRADAALGLAAHGLVKAATASGASCTVITGGIVNGLAGRTPGAPQFLGESGQVTEDPATGTGHLLQEIGTGISAQRISLEIQPAVELA